MYMKGYPYQYWTCFAEAIGKAKKGAGQEAGHSIELRMHAHTGCGEIRTRTITEQAKSEPISEAI